MKDSFYLYVVDTETTSLDPVEGDVIEIAMKRFTPNEDGSTSEESRVWYLRAMNPAGIQDRALAVNHHKREEILGITAAGREKYLLPTDVLPEIESWIMDDNVSSMDRVFCGQNPNFDIDHLRSLWKKNDRSSAEDFPFAVENGNRILDTKMIVCLFDLCTGRRRKAYGLGALVKSCGIKKDRAHTAIGDVNMTSDLLMKLIAMIREPVVEKFNDCYGDTDE